MKKILQKIEQNKYFPYIILSIIGILVSMPLIYTNIINLDDGQIHLFRIISLNLSIENSSFPYLITPFFCRNFGYTMVAFYPPLVTYIPYILGIFTNTFHIGIKLFTSLSIILSGIFMYNFINEVTKNKWISFLAGIIYMLAPYHLEMIFTRFAIGEFTAYAFIPIVFQGLYNLINGNKKKHYYIAIGAIGILLSHTITTIYTALFCAIYVICNFKKFLKKDIIIKCIINVIFILLISAFFIIPLIEFETQAHYLIFYPEGMRTTPDMVQETTLKAIQFIKDIEEDGVSFILGIPTFVMLFIGIFSWKYIDKNYKKFYIFNFILGIICLLMCLKIFPWKNMPLVLTEIQFVWRLIGFAMFFLAPVMAMNVYYLIKNIKIKDIQKVVYLWIILAIMASTILKLNKYELTTDKVDAGTEEYVRNNPVITHFQVNRDYLPYKTKRTIDGEQFGYISQREDKVYILQGNTEIENETKQGLNLTFYINNTKPNTILELPYIFFPGYTVTITNEEKTVELKTRESDNGFVQISLPEEIKDGQISLTYTGTKLEKASYIISAISVLAFIIYLIYYRKKVNNKN